MKKTEAEKRCCGSCDSHNAYEYPDRVFCSTRYGQDKEPIVETLWCCDEWNLVNQQCYCVREALRSHKKP
jgi:hypothetical protein